MLQLVCACGLLLILYVCNNSLLNPQLQPQEESPPASLEMESSGGGGRKHTVLVSNDDGIQAPGLTALVAALAESPDIEVFVCAPSGERSAQSHAITLGRCVSTTT